MTVACNMTINFGSAGNSLAFLGGGWAASEAGFTWGTGPESHLVLPQRETAAEYFLTLDVVPYVKLPEVPSQRLIVSVNDTVIGSADLCRPTLLGYRISAAVARRADRMVITLQHPDAARPKDFSDTQDDRQLAFAVIEAKLHPVGIEAKLHPVDIEAKLHPVASKARLQHVVDVSASRLLPGLMLGAAETYATPTADPAELAEWVLYRTGLTLPQIAIEFESLGENCEFGLFQRRCDAEPLGLLRFSSTFMRNLIRGIDDGFVDLGQPDDVDPRLEGDPQKEYMIHEKKYGLVYHTFVYEGQRSVWLMREQESARLKFLRRKFIEELGAADKIFVYKLGGGVSEEEILPLYMALRRYGDATLLWVVPAVRDRPVGTVEVVMPGLFKGYIDRFAPSDNAHDLSFDGWLRVCANAFVLHRLGRPANQPAQAAAEAPIGTTIGLTQANTAKPGAAGDLAPGIANDDVPSLGTDPDGAE
jgi:hypothetical protein